MALVTFEPGARTAWHTHTLGQTLIVTAGCGWVQREGGPAEAIHRAPPGSRGLAMGAYTAFLDLPLGLSSPVLGLVASGAGMKAVFGASALVVLASAAVTAGSCGGRVACRRFEGRGGPAVRPAPAYIHFPFRC